MPARKPALSIIAQGSTHVTLMSTRDAIVLSQLPACPAWLSDLAKAEYVKIGTMLIDRGVMAESDVHALVMIAVCHATWVEAEQAILEHGLLVKGRDATPTINPFRKVANEAHDRLRQLLVEFGMTPGSRARAKLTEHAPLEAMTEPKHAGEFELTKLFSDLRLVSRHVVNERMSK